MEIKVAIPKKWVYKLLFYVCLPGSLLTGSVVRELVLQRVCRSLGKAASLVKINVNVTPAQCGRSKFKFKFKFNVAAMVSGCPGFESPRTASFLVFFASRIFIFWSKRCISGV
jgi:hypothetical protein